MFAVINVETGDFYSESPAFKKEVALKDCDALISQFFTTLFSPPFFVASVVAPPESPDLGTAPQKTGGTLGN